MNEHEAHESFLSRSLLFLLMELSEQAKAVGDGGETESKEDAREQQKQTRESRLCARRRRSLTVYLSFATTED